MRFAIALVMVGCGFQPSSLIDDGGGFGSGSGSGSGSGLGSGSGSCTTFSQQLDTCALTFGAGIEIVGTYNYSTDTGVLASTTGVGTISVSRKTVTLTMGATSVDADVIATSSLLIDSGASLRVTGTRPLVIVSTAGIDIEGVLDLGAGGAGIRTVAQCTTSAGVAGAAHTGGAPGGGGGGMNGAGGDGGNGDHNNQGGVDGGAGGGGIDFPGVPLGGCPGGDGGMPNNGTGGLGGGAVDLIARTTINVATFGQIEAGGGGGAQGTATDGGAGGGGSGGIILFEALTRIEIDGQVAANGGGGGGGAGNADGQPGFNGLPMTAPTPGGMKGGNGGNGGVGGAFADRDGHTPSDADGGGGGGGGGAGYVATSPIPGFNHGGFCSPQQMGWQP